MLIFGGRIMFGNKGWWVLFEGEDSVFEKFLRKIREFSLVFIGEWEWNEG